MSLTVGSKDLSEQSLPPLATKKPREPSYNGWYAAQFLNSASASTIDPFLPIFARKIGATSIEIGILSGIFSLINISQIIWAKVAAKGENRLIAFLGKIISGLLFIPMAFLKTGQIVILLILRFLQGLFTSAAAPTETSLMASHIPQRDRTKRMQTFTRLALIGGLLGTLFAGFAFTYLNSELKVSDEVAFTVIFILTGLLGILTAFVFLASVPEYRGLPEPDPSSIIYHSVSSSPSRTSLFAKIQLYLRHFSNFWWFCVFAMVFYFGVYLASPFFIILEIEEYGFSFAEAAILTSISTACQILFIAYERKLRLFDLYGRRVIIYPALLFIWMASLLVLVPHFFTSIPAFLWCVGVWIIMGIGWGMMNSAIAIFLLDIAHPKYRVTLVATYNTLVGLMMFLSPIVGGILIFWSKEIAIAFFMRSLLLVAAAVLLVRVKDPIYPSSLLLPIRNVFRQYVRGMATRARMMIVHAYPRGEKEDFPE